MKTIRQSVAVKVISWVLIAALSLSSFSELAYAADISPAEKVIKEDEVTEENITEKSQSTTTYYLGEGKNMTVWHGGQVRFEDEDGNLTDYEPQLEEIEKEKTLQGKDLKGYSFTNKEGDAKHYLPEKIGEDAPLIMEKEDFAIEMSLADETVKMLGLEDAHGIIKEETVQTIEGEEKLPVTAVYENKDSASLALTSTPGSVKETITLLEKPESSVLKYEIKLSGLTARKNVLDEGITYYDREKNIAGYMASPWMNDASGKNYSENIKCTLKKSDEKGKYIVEMHIDEEYLSSEDTQYPVVIDPTNTWQGNSQIRDAYVISGSTYGDTNFYDSGTKKMPVGKNNTGTHRTYLKLYDLYAVTKGCSVTSAKLTVYETGSGQAGQSIGICRVPSSWEPADITNNNRPVGTTLYSSITSKGTEGSSSVFDILTYVKNVASGSITNYGLMLYNKMDNPGIATFYGSRTGDTAKRPKLVVTYYSIPTVATASELKIKEGKQGNKYNKTLYVKNSEDTYFSFSGIISNGLKRVEQRIRYWNDETQTSGSIVKDYGESTTVTNGGSMISLPEGCYINYIRGVNTAGVAGEAKTTGYIHVDKTTPTINSFNLKQTTTESSPTNDKCPEIEWKVADKHFRSVSVIQNGKFVKTGLTPKVGSYKYAEGNTAITKSGKYDIKIRAYDWAGNYKDSAVKSYYVDKTVPTIDSVFLKDNNGNEIGTNYTIESDPIISFNDVTDNNDMTTDCISYAVTKKGAAAPTTYKVPTDISINSSKPYIGSFSLNSEDENLETGEYTIYIRATDKAGNTSAYKTLDYKKDISKPTGSLKVTEQGTVEEVISLKNTANIVVTASGTGSELEKLEMKLFKVNSDGKEIEKHDFGAVSTTDNYDLNTLKYDNGDYRLKLYLEDAVGNTDTVTKDVTIANPLKAPSLTTVPTNDGNAIVNWKVEDISKVAKFQYRVEGSEAWTDVSVSENDNTGSIDVVLPESEGQYKVHVRAVDIHGLEGMSATVKCTFDKTQPTAEITAFESGYLIGNISDDNSVEWTLSVKESSESDSEYTELKAGTEKISSGKIAFIDFNGEQYVIGKTYNVKLTAKDTAGNISTTIYNITKTTGIYETKLEAELDVAHLKHQAAEENKIIYPTDITQISLSNLDDIEGTVTWYVDNVKKTTGTVYEDDFSTDKENSVYEEHTEYPVLVINKKPDGTRTYSRDILCNVIKNVTFDETSLEDVVDLNGSKVVSFRIMDSSSGSSYFVKTDNKEFKTVSTGETVYIADLFENVAYAENITVKASLQNEDVSIQLDIIEADNIETFELSNIENYRPEDITVADKINYKTYIKWQNEINEDTPDNIYYEVYRGTEDDFVPGPDTLAATNVRAGYFSEVNINFSEGFYYKIRAVEKTENGKYFSSFSEQIYSKVIDSDEYTKRMGVKEYWEFADIETPNGDISVEKSMGNMVYQQTDAMLPNEGLEVELTRTYNSQSSAKSAFGVGWTHDYDIELLRICKDGDINDANFVMKDGSGTIYHFVKNDDGVYTSSLGKYINLKKEEISEDVKIPARIVGVAGSGDEKKTITVNSSYTMSTKDNIEYRFNSGGQLVYMEEANGNFMIFEYEPEKGLIQRAVTSKNLAMEFIYNSEEDTDKLTVKELKLPNGSSLLYEYEGNPSKEHVRLVKVTEKTKDGETVSYEYDYDNSDIPNVNKIYDALGNGYYIEYNNKDQVEAVSYPDGDKITLEYDVNAEKALNVTPEQLANLENLNMGMTTVTSKVTKGEVVSSETDSFNGFGNCILSIDAEGYETKYEYLNHLLAKTITKTDSYYIDDEGYVQQAEFQDKEETTTYDENENEISDVEEDGTVTEYDYDEDANENCDDLPVTEKETTKDENGNTVEVFDLSYEYDEAGNETEEYDAVSDTTTVTEYYSSDGETSLKGEVKKETEYLGTKDDGKVQSITEYEYIYADDGSKTEKLTQTCGEDTIIIETVYDSMGNEIKSTDSRGKTTESTYDGFGRLRSTKYTDGDIVTNTSKEYNANGAVTKETAEDGTVTSYTYDNMNRVNTRTVTKGDFSKTWTVTYGYETINVYDGSGAPVEIKNAFYTKETNPDGKVTSMIYQDHLGRTVKQFENGIYVDMTYDGQGNVYTQYEYADGQKEENGLLTMFIYDSAGNLTDTVLNPEYVAGKGYYTGGTAIVTSSEYDPSGNEIATIDGEGNRTEFSYDIEGNITSVTLPNGKTTSYQYDVVNHDGTTSNFTIDAKGNKSEVKSDQGDLDILVQDLGDGTVDPIKTVFEYDAKENVTKETDSEGNYRTYEYDGRDRMTESNYYDSSKNRTLKTTYAYDISDNLTEMRDYKVSGETETLIRITKYTYDELKRLVGYAELDGPAEPTAEEITAATITYYYDIDDNLTKVEYPETGSKIKALNFIYNEYGWITDVTADIGGLVAVDVRDYVYSADGKIHQIKDYKGVLTGESGYIVKEYSYDEFERVTGITYKDSSDLTTIKESYTYTYDKNNNIISEEIFNDYPTSEADKVHEIRTHEYNDIGQLILTQVEDKMADPGSNATIYEYSYDSVGNRTKETKETGLAANELIDAEDPSDGSDEDAATEDTAFVIPFVAVVEADTTEGETGDDTTIENQLTTTTYTYNSLNQLVSSSEDTEGVNTSEKTYVYDKNGSQLSETDSITGESRTMTYDAAGNMSRLVAKNGDTITLTQENVYNGNGQRIRKTEADDTINYYYQGANVLYTTDGTGALSAQNLVGISENTIATTRDTGDSEAYYVYNKDIRESTTNLVDSSGSSEVSYEYTDYGETEITGNKDFYNEICYAGGIYDASTGIYYLNARYYDPENANFLSQDSYRGEIGDPESLNYYAYCYGNPITYTDPSGHIPVLVVVSVKVGARIIVKHVVKKAAKKYVKKTVKKSVKKYVKKTVKKTAKKTYKKPKKSKITKKKNNKTNKKSRAKSSTKKTNKKKNVSKAKKQPQKEVQQRSNAGCFVAGTMISTDDGFMPIEEIKVGDRVWSEDTATGEKALKKVKKVFVREKDSIIRLSINGEVINTTDEHPFWIKDQGWIPAGSLNAGDLVKLQSGDYVPIEEYQVVILDEPIPVYNFHVEDYECYYVSEQNVLVHNNSCAQPNTKHGNQRIKERGFSQKQIDDIIKNYSQKVYQSGGRTVYAKKNNGYYDVVITNNNGQIITIVGGKTKSLKTWKAVTKMLNNNGGYSSLPIG